MKFLIPCNHKFRLQFTLKVEQYVEAVVKKNICIESTYEYVVTKENEKAVDRAIAEVHGVKFKGQTHLRHEIDIFQKTQGSLTQQN